MECLTRYVGIKEICTPDTVQPLFWLDDIEGIDRTVLGQIAKQTVPSGLQFGRDIIDASARFLYADIETIIPKGYNIKSSLNSFCNSCSYTSLNSSASNTGIIIKNTSTSVNGYLSIDSLKVMINSTGVLTVVITDGITPKEIEADFVAGTEVMMININYKTNQKTVKVYFKEVGVYVTALSCPVEKSCGCSGTTKQSKDIQITGMLSGSEFATQYGFIPCASVVCSMDNIICSIVNQQPRLFGLALLYRSAARLYSEPAVSQRNNLFASFSKEQKEELAGYYLGLYQERLYGSDKVKGIRDNMASVLNNIKDPCIDCARQNSTAWATG